MGKIRKFTKRKKWSVEEENFLKNNLHLTNAELSKKLNVSEKSVNARKIKMGLTKNQKNWSKEEIDFLLDNPDMGYDELCKNINRTKKAIKYKRGELGLTEEHKFWTEEEKQKLIEVFNNDYEFLSEEFNRSKNSIQMKAMELGLLTPKKLTEQEKEEVLKYKGKSSREISIEMNISYGRARKLKQEVFGKNKNPKSWTKEEDEYLIKNYNNKKVQEISEYLGRTAPSLKARAKKLGIVKSPFLTQEEVLAVRDLGDIPISDILKFTQPIGIGEGKVRKIKHILYGRAKSNIRWTKEEEEYITKNCKIKSLEEISTHLNRNKKSVMGKFHIMGLRFTDHQFGKEEDSVRKFLNSFNLNFQSTRKIIKPKEIDMYDPKAPFSLEYCGLYWHSTANDRIDENYHLNKFLECEKQGVRLVTLYADEWNFNQEKVKSYLQRSLGAIEKSDFNIKEIPPKEAAKFSKDNDIHPQSRNILKAFGAFSGELIGVIMFYSHRKEIRMKISYGLNRDFDRNKLFVFAAENVDFDKIIHFNNCRFPDNMSDLGFSFEKDYPPKCHFVDPNGDKNRRSKNNSKMEKIFNCGYRKYSLDLNDLQNRSGCT